MTKARRWHIRCIGVLATVLTLTVGGMCSDDVDFNRDVRPILADNCFECHGPDEGSREADLRLDVLDDAMGWVIEPNQASDSSLIQRLVTDDDAEVMPPREAKRRPTREQIAILKKWIEHGAIYESHWAFVAPQRPAIPQVTNSSWPRNPIDHFVVSHLQAESLSPNPDAPPRLLARRLSLSLTGLPILPEQADQFAGEFGRNADQAVQSLVDQLLESDAYGEHRAWFWMDAAHYADTNGYQGDAYRVMWPWRDWLIRNLNANLPFDEMTELMLAGDLLVPEEQQDWQSADWIANDEVSDRLIATGFLRNHRYDTGSGTIPAESKFENAADRMETVGTVWMGMTMLCARCHSHKYDPIENREYYELLSFFDNVPEVGAALKAASHPYIHAPTQKQRGELGQLHAAAKKANAAMLAAEPELRERQSEWEANLNNDDHHGIRVKRGLQFRFAENAIQLHGDTLIEESNEPIALCAGNKRWTISFWFRPESASDGAIFSSVEEPERYRPGIQADMVDGKLRVRHVCRWVNSYIEFESRAKLDVGAWYHVTFRCDGRMQGLAYSASLNGSDTQMKCTHPVTNDSAGKSGKAPLMIGGSPLMSGAVGVLKDLRFYDRTLDQSEVRSLADNRSTAEIAKIPSSDRSPTEIDSLRLAFLESEELPAVLRELRDAQLVGHANLDKAIRDTPTTMVMKEGRTKHTRVRMAGVFDSLGATVEASTPDFLPPLRSVAHVARRRSEWEHHSLATDATRLELARWLMHPDHPLTARVAVNRIWQTLWGKGFVASPENFGTQTGKPLHADLLDWLATEYVRLGWDTKALIKLIVSSRTYRQSSDATEAMWASDPANRHLARGPRFRLPVNLVRDQALFLSGRLDKTLGGPPVIIDDVIGQNGKVVNLPFEKSDRRRTLYTFWKRNSPHPMLAVFDVADRNQCEVRTMRTNTPLQALVTLNEPGFVAAAKDLGKRAASKSTTVEGRLCWVWQACTGRVPRENQTQQLVSMHERYLELSGGDESQAWTAICNVLLNLDATLTLE